MPIISFHKQIRLVACYSLEGSIWKDSSSLNPLTMLHELHGYLNLEDDSFWDYDYFYLHPNMTF